ncbi:MAG: phosphotransferase family protein [Pseudonocardia sp.]|nr:phosphotransferase family protein [Pseudonocardia sp.]
MSSGQALPGLNLGRLERHLDVHLPAMRTAPLTAELLAGGRSNLTYLLRDGSAEWVLRRPPLGHVLATAHDMTREHRVISALHGTAVPVPEPLLLCVDAEVLGTPFYLMERVAGTPYRRAEELAALGPQRTRAITERSVDTLADLHTVVPEEVGLADFGKPDDFLQRQVRRWKSQLDASCTRAVSGIDELHAGLAGRVPAGRTGTVVHGDFRLDNLLVDDADSVTAVLDWEMATLGDPLTDLALMVAYRELPTDNDVVADAPMAPGAMSADEMLERYATRSGRALDDIAFYLALANFKLAVIFEGVHCRYRQGQTVGPGFAAIGDLVPCAVEAGLMTLRSA